MKCTLRDRRSSLETISGQRADFASFSAAARPGRRSSASAPAPVWISWCQALSANPPRAPRVSISLRCAASPKPLRPCSRVLTLSIQLLLASRSPPHRWRHDKTAPSIKHVRLRPRLCENASARFLGVNFSHVEAISGVLSDRIGLLAILRADRNEFSHSLGQERQFSLTNCLPESGRFACGGAASCAQAGGGSFAMSTTQRHSPSASRRQIDTPRICTVISAPLGAGTVISSVPDMYAIFPSSENTGFSDTQ